MSEGAKSVSAPAVEANNIASSNDATPAAANNTDAVTIWFCVYLDTITFVAFYFTLLTFVF